MALYVNAIGKVRWDLLLCSHRSPSQGSSLGNKKGVEQSAWGHPI